MKKIQVKDKNFSIFIKSEEIQNAVKEVAARLNEDYKDKKPLFVVVLNGAFMFAADLYKNITIECEISFVKLSSYLGTKSTQIVKELIGLNENINGRDIIIVEDIIDTGITMEKMLEHLDLMNTSSVKIVTLLFKPEAFKKDYKIDYIGIEIPNDFIVGYGLDYDGLARNLADIYILTS
jgi:hypoxanthine phosphoribosyltransferase